MTLSRFALTPAAPISLAAIMPGQSADFSLPLAANGPLSTGPVTNIIQMAVKNNIDIFYFQHQIPLHLLYVPSGKLEVS